ncbi:MAG: efflux RND transporter periplasmic adaptor subunit [Spirochaetes bacterium]|nr:efflux RND transporter periplasmic adaptor subunit [Spirochaetota bacterium]
MRNRLILIFTVLILVILIISCSKKKELSKEILYYTDGMHPSVRVTPEEYAEGKTKCPICNMDLVPVYKQTGDHSKMDHKAMNELKTLKITKRQEVLANVRTEKVGYHQISKKIRTSGSIEYDETKNAFVSAYFSGRIDKLYVNFAGAGVKKGQALALIYSPDLISTQQEYIDSLKNSRIHTNNSLYTSLLTSAKERLKLWGISDNEIREIEETGEPKKYMTIYSPINGIVINKNVNEGKYIKEGEPIFNIVDLTTVWMMADIYEFEIPFIKKGQGVSITSVANPGSSFYGRITFIDPVLNTQTRSLKVRVEVKNSSMKLKPGMFVTAEINANLGKKLAIPKEALIDTGVKKVVYVQVREEEDGIIFSPRIVETGVEDDNYISIVKGVKTGEKVVTTASFLIDSQAQLSGTEGSGYGGSIKVEKHQH